MPLMQKTARISESERTPVLMRVLVILSTAALILLLSWRASTSTVQGVRVMTDQRDKMTHTRSRPGGDRPAVGPCLHGSMLLEVCFCDPGYVGISCAHKDAHQPGACSESQDDCFVSRQNGVCKISTERWRRAQAAEFALWRSMGSVMRDDRSADHLEGYNQYQQVPPFLGKVLEVGCGPWTQLGPMLDTRSDWKVDNITLWEPGAEGYIRDVATCAYKDGRLRGHPVEIVSKGAEDIQVVAHYDTVMMTNVLEHVQNLYVILENIHRALKPGGLLIFNDKWWDAYNHSTPVGMGGPGQAHLDHLYHPIRCSRRVFEHFLSHFLTLHKAVDHPAITKYKNNGVYFIGVKKWV